MIGLIIADEKEVKLLPYKLIDKEVINQFTFFKYENNIVAVCSGIGLANAAAATQELISSFRIKEIVSYGAVGATFKLNLYDVITPQRIYYYDVITPWYKRGKVPGEQEYYENNLESEINWNLASGSSFLWDEKQVLSLQKELNVDIFDMESAAIAQIAFKNKVPINIIKVVSDVIGFDDNSSLSTVNERISKAGEKAAREATKIIDAINAEGWD